MDDSELARYLQQQEDGLYSESESENEWTKKRTTKKRQGVASKAKAKKPKVANPAFEAGKKPPAKKMVWTPEEEKLFLEGLELYGRDWAMIAMHCGNTRAKQNISSHAQKHFIKLFIGGHCLPAKVIESGSGYTLSGKPLDPNSAALKAYGNNTEYRVSLKNRNSLPQSSTTEESPASAQTTIAPHLDTIVPQTAVQNEPPLITAKKKITKSPEIKRRNPKPTVPRKEKSIAPVTTERSEYSTRRLRTARKQTYRFVDNRESDPLHMVTTKSYTEDHIQPFNITVLPQATTVMDFHAHLAVAEIIGLLAGIWDPETQTIQVIQAFPCRELQNGNNAAIAETQVEMDPVSEMEVREEIANLDLIVVGWYHSHPTFKPFPSNTDVENQYNYQNLFKGVDSANAAYFVGAIVGPYDTELPSEKSAFNWFHVQMDDDRPQAYILSTEQLINRTTDVESVVLSKMRKLVDYYKDYEHRTQNWSAIWRLCKRVSFDSSMLM